MKGEERRDTLLGLLNDKTPVSAGVLAGRLGVSRQVIVQDVALLRSGGHGILSTPRGYVLREAPAVFSRVFKVRHDDGRTAEELNLIVDAGGVVESVFVHHRVYGRLEAPLRLGDRVQVAEYMRSITAGKSSLLKNVTDGYHYHAVSAADEAALDGIEALLRVRGFLVER